MKIALPVLLLLLAVVSSCEKDSQDLCNNSYPERHLNELKKLLIEIRQGDEKFLDIKYDNLNRITKRIYYDNNLEYMSQRYIYDTVGRIDSIITQYSSSASTEKFIYGADQKVHTAIENFSEQDSIIKELNYDQCRIRKVTVKGSTWYSVYSYDLRGNTTEIINYLDDQVVNRTKYRYDNRINPLRYQVTDPYLIQNNNVTFMYFERLSEWTPLEASMSYEYDDDGFPVKETRTMGQSANSVIFNYVYDE